MNELADYVATRSQHAFAAVVDRYADLVYASAVRHVGDRALAEDITQGVFALLARKAHKVPRERPLSAWLLTTTRYLAMNERRLRDNRRRLEQTVATMQQQSTSPDAQPNWRELGPLVDEGLANLRAADRDLLMLRYFESQSIRDVAMVIGVSEQAAGKRVQRALERLRVFFQRRGVTAADVTPALATLAGGAAAPEALRATLIGMSASAAKTSAGALLTGAGVVMAAKTAAVAAVLIACGAGVVAYTRPAPSSQSAAATAAATTAPSTQDAEEAALRTAKNNCFPKAVCDILLAERMRVAALLALKGESLQSQAYALDAQAMGWSAVVLSQAGTGENVLRMGSTGMNGYHGVFTDTGQMLRVERVREGRPGLELYRVSANVTEPWAVGEVKKFYWLMRDGQHSPRGDGRLPFYMSNAPGHDCTQQLALVTSKHWRLVSSAETPATTKEAGEFVIYFWERAVTRSETFRVDAEVQRTAR
jgi:RNA polymerase sigma factor (sigma-70 family)